MIVNPVKDIPLWRFNNLSEETGVRHFVTGRSPERAGEFTLSLSSMNDSQAVHNNRNALKQALGDSVKQVYFPRQVHGTHIVQVTSQTSNDHLADTDALITNEPGCCVGVLAADCVPILLYDRVNRAVAAVHSGWRGTVARIVEKTLKKMKTLYGTEGRDVVAGIGPSICKGQYEVGEEVIEAVRSSFTGHADLLDHTKPGKAQFDLWLANRIQLVEFGVPPENIEISGLCTMRENRHFFSARMGDRGRFASGIMLIA